MRIGILNEEGENRVALTPDVVKMLEDEKNEVIVETNAGSGSFIEDWAFQQVKARTETREKMMSQIEMLISVTPPSDETLGKLNPGTTVISSFQPFNHPEIVSQLSGYPITAFSLDMIPRITAAQTMDVLSSMASLAGYKAVLVAAGHLPRYFPMLTTAAGSIPPARVLILGAGVAGLQAIATARRLGAIVEAFDTRLAAREEVESLGARFVMVEGAQDAADAGGYAVEQTEEYKKQQRELIHEKAAKADAIITTALLRGKPAPVLITREMVNEMKPGSVIVDLAAAGGGNCELTQNRKTIREYDVTIIGDSNLESTVPQHSSQMYAKNIHNYLKLLIKEGEFAPEWDNEIIKQSCLVRHEKHA